MKILPNIRSNYSLDFRGVNGSGDSQGHRNGLPVPGLKDWLSSSLASPAVLASLLAHHPPPHLRGCPFLGATRMMRGLAMLAMASTASAWWKDQDTKTRGEVSTQ